MNHDIAFEKDDERRVDPARNRRLADRGEPIGGRAERCSTWAIVAPRVGTPARLAAWVPVICRFWACAVASAIPTQAAAIAEWTIVRISSIPAVKPGSI